MWKKGLMSLIVMFVMVLILPSCSSTRTLKNNSVTTDLTQDQIARQSMAGVYLSEYINEYYSDDCSGETGAIAEDNGQVTLGAVPNEIDQAFTALVTSNDESAEVTGNKLNVH